MSAANAAGLFDTNRLSMAERRAIRKNFSSLTSFFPHAEAVRIAEYSVKATRRFANPGAIAGQFRQDFVFACFSLIVLVLELVLVLDL